MIQERKTKIICTIGPSSRSKETIANLIDKGMNVVRLNFSHAIYKEAEETISLIRKIAAQKNKNIAILQDLQGLKIRVSDLTAPILAKEGAVFKFITQKEYGAGEIPVQYKNFIKDISTGERILIADGSIELIATKKSKDAVFAKVVVGGEIKSRKGINLPDTKVSADSMTDKDFKDVEFGIKHGVDYIALSFVRNAKDIEQLRGFIKKLKSQTKIIAKIELPEAMENLDEIVHNSDGVMVARGDLGVEFPPQKVPVLQKKIIEVARKHGKPVIIATQMLMSMVEKPNPTRAEVNDVANAVLDNADAVMLSDETASGKYPAKAVDIMRKIIEEVESSDNPAKHYFGHSLRKENLEFSVPAYLGYNAIYLSNDLESKYIIVFTKGGFSALQVARFRPKTPIIVFTLDSKVARELALSWGMHKIYILDSFDDKFWKAAKLIKKEKLVKKGDKILTVSSGKDFPDGVLNEIRIFEFK